MKVWSTPGSNIFPDKEVTIIQLRKKIKDINWKEGSGIVMFYISLMWLIVLSSVLFIEYYNMFSHVGKSQLYADIVADGSAFIGNNGWGLSEDEAKSAMEKLKAKNESTFDDTELSIGFSNRNPDGSLSNVEPAGTNKNNTVDATAKLKTRMLTENRMIRKTKTASTQITYSGGLRVVLEAYKHSYEYWQSEAGQTWYVWGGGHGIPSDSDAWERFADCSGFVSGVFRKCGYDVSSSSYTGSLESTGVTVATDYQGLETNARPGDIILYWRGSTADMDSDHVTIYAGCHNGVHYQIHSSGGRSCTAENPGRGAARGVHIAPIERGCQRVQVQRIVDTDGIAVPIPELSVAGLSATETQIYVILKEYGITNIGIAAILGNFKAESGCDPLAKEDVYNRAVLEDYAKKIQDSVYNHNGQTYTKLDFIMEGVGRMSLHRYSEGYGLGQWTTVALENPLADRKAHLWDYADKLGSDVTNLQTQVNYAMHEARENGNVRPQFSIDVLNSYSNVDEATKYFQLAFEGILNSTLIARQANARYYLNCIS